jgi:hypothetical protein
MGFTRTTAPEGPPSRRTLTADMIGIGMVFAGDGSANPNIESTLLCASAEGMEQGDLHVLAVLCSWLGCHARWINADRLTRLAGAHVSERVRLFWAAFAFWQHKDHRFARLRRLHRGPREELLPEGARLRTARLGEDLRFMHGPLRVDARSLRERLGDVLLPDELAKRHRTYRWRMIIGPSYRADLWAELTEDADQPVSELARRAHTSIGAAWQVQRDYWAFSPR